MMDDLLQEMIDPGAAAAGPAPPPAQGTTVGIVGLAVVGATSLDHLGAVQRHGLHQRGDLDRTVDLAVGATAFTSPRPAAWRSGDTVYTPVTVSNDGSLRLRYAIEYCFRDARHRSGARTDARGRRDAAVARERRAARDLRDGAVRRRRCGGRAAPARSTGPRPAGDRLHRDRRQRGDGPGRRRPRASAGTNETLGVRVHLPIGADNSLPGHGARASCACRPSRSRTTTAPPAT